MFPVFHVAIPLLIVEIPSIKNKYRFNRISLIFGALFPDIIDKSLMLFKISSGRGISHTLLFVIVSFVVTHLLTKRNYLISVPILIGTISHLILDLPEVPLFFPFIMYEFIYLEDPLSGWLYSLFHDPVVLITEISGILILIFILTSNQLYNYKRIVNYLQNKNNAPT